jgi:hypothetical protein
LRIKELETQVGDLRKLTDDNEVWIL